MVGAFLNQYLFHWSPDKAIFIGGQTISWDARCAGIYIGYGLGGLYHVFVTKRTNMLPPIPILLIILFLFLPLFLDVFSLVLDIRRPSNNVRYLTGLMFGYALSVFLYPAFIRLWSGKNHGNASKSYLIRLCVPMAMIGTVFFLRYCDYILSYIVLQTLAFWGFLSLLAGFLFAALGTIRKSWTKR